MFVLPSAHAFGGPVPDHLHDHHTRALLSTGGTVSAEEKGWEYGIGGYQPPNKISYSLQDPVVIACDWVGFLCLFGASVVLMYKLFSFKGPDGDSDFFIGYREHKCISIYVNLIAALTYWGRVSAHMNGDVGLGLSVNFYKYFDYIFTCPILVVLSAPCDAASKFRPLLPTYMHGFSSFRVPCLSCPMAPLQSKLLTLSRSADP